MISHHQTIAEMGTKKCVIESQFDMNWNHEKDARLCGIIKKLSACIIRLIFS